MQKRIGIISVSIVLIIFMLGIIIINNNSNNEYSFTQNGIKYALTLDGNKITSFPSKGMYKVQVKCDGADGSWLYDEWSLSLENVIGDISCDINFNTITKTYLNDYIISLAGTEQGTGQVINETANIPDYSSAVAISGDAYTSQSVFSSSSASSTSGTAVSDAYNFANDTWTSVPRAMTSETYYHFKFNPKENGYYQMCYDLSAGNTNNNLSVYVNGTYKMFGTSGSLFALSDSSQNGCLVLGYVTTSDYIKIIQRAYTDISTLSFSIKKVTIVNSVDAGLRYEGMNPNNYVWFNNEYWRIIGVFDSASHGQDNKNLVKITYIRTVFKIQKNRYNIHAISIVS